MTHDFKAGRSWESPLNCMPSEHIRLHFTCYHFTGRRNLNFGERTFSIDYIYQLLWAPLKIAKF
jgi:hypothetical protein